MCSSRHRIKKCLFFIENVLKLEKNINIRPGLNPQLHVFDSADYHEATSTYIIIYIPRQHKQTKAKNGLSNSFHCLVLDMILLLLMTIREFMAILKKMREQIFTYIRSKHITVFVLLERSLGFSRYVIEVS